MRRLTLCYGRGTDDIFQCARLPPAAFVGHERELSELNVILADVAKAG